MVRQEETDAGSIAGDYTCCHPDHCKNHRGGVEGGGAAGVKGEIKTQISRDTL